MARTLASSQQTPEPAPLANPGTSGFFLVSVSNARCFTLLVAAVSLAACSEPQPVFRSGPPPYFAYAPRPYGNGYYRPPEENDWDEDGRYPDRPPSDEPEPESTPQSPEDYGGTQNSPNGTDTQPEVNPAPTPAPAPLPTARSLGNGRVESPYAPGKQVDVAGFPPGSTVRDPYTGRLFIVPIPQTGPQ